MAQDQNNLLWIDMEMTGLSPDTDRIIEVALVVTDSTLNIVDEAPVLVVHQSDEILAGMDNWNKSTHGKSGLIDKVRASVLTEQQAEQHHRLPEGEREGDRSGPARIGLDHIEDGLAPGGDVHEPPFARSGG